MAYKPLMDWFDEHEGRKAGDSHKAIQKERARQGYAKSKAVAKKAVSHSNDTEEGRIANLEILRSKMHKAWGPKNKSKVDMHFPHLKK